MKLTAWIASCIVLHHVLSVGSDKLEVVEDLAEAAQRLARSSKHDEAVQLWRKAASLRPFSAFLHASLGESLAQQHLFVEAETSFQAAIAAGGQDVRSLGNLGAIQLNLGKPNEAAASLRSAFNLDPTSVRAKSSLAMVLKQLEEFEEAESLLEELTDAVAMLSNQDLEQEGLRRSEVFTHLGQTHGELQKLDQAHMAFHQALFLQPGQPMRWGDMAKVAMLGGRGHDALCLLLKAQELQKAQQVHFKQEQKLTQATAAAGAAVAAEARAVQAQVQLILRVQLPPWLRQQCTQRATSRILKKKQNKKSPAAARVEGAGNTSATVDAGIPTASSCVVHTRTDSTNASAVYSLVQGRGTLRSVILKKAEGAEEVVTAARVREERCCLMCFTEPDCKAWTVRRAKGKKRAQRARYVCAMYADLVLAVPNDSNQSVAGTWGTLALGNDAASAAGAPIISPLLAADELGDGSKLSISALGQTEQQDQQDLLKLLLGLAASAKAKYLYASDIDNSSSSIEHHIDQLQAQSHFCRLLQRSNALEYERFARFKRSFARLPPQRKRTALTNYLRIAISTQVGMGAQPLTPRLPVTVGNTELALQWAQWRQILAGWHGECISCWDSVHTRERSLWIQGGGGDASEQEWEVPILQIELSSFQWHAFLYDASTVLRQIGNDRKSGGGGGRVLLEAVDMLEAVMRSLYREDRSEEEGEEDAGEKGTRKRKQRAQRQRKLLLVEGVEEQDDGEEDWEGPQYGYCSSYFCKHAKAAATSGNEMLEGESCLEGRRRCVRMVTQDLVMSLHSVLLNGSRSHAASATAAAHFYTARSHFPRAVRWTDVMHTPTETFDADLALVSCPFPADCTCNESTTCHFDAPDFAWVTKVEAAFPTIRDELRRFMQTTGDGGGGSGGGGGSSGGDGGDGGGAWELPGDHELQTDGGWSELLLYNKGRLNATNCRHFPTVCRTIATIPEMTGSIRGRWVPGQVTVRRMLPGTHLRAHAGPTNERLTAHLGLIVPQLNGHASMQGNTSSVENGRLCIIRVANESKGWEEGKVLLFDDSYEHEVWHRGSGAAAAAGSKEAAAQRQEGECVGGEGGGSCAGADPAQMDRVVLYMSVWHPRLGQPAAHWMPGTMDKVRWEDALLRTFDKHAAEEGSKEEKGPGKKGERKAAKEGKGAKGKKRKKKKKGKGT
jgi:Flp pilus assembly protein TadD